MKFSDNRLKALALASCTWLIITKLNAQQLDTSRNRVKTDLQFTLPYIGTLKPVNATEVTSSNWILGCETLDRDFADYEAYKTYLVPLGIKRLRMQAGWAKTEKTKGVYNWQWLDKIIDDAASRNLQPWLETSYGNSIYPGGGGENLSAGIPTSAEALAAWDKWVEALVTHYKNKVQDWEIWNEPNFGDNTINTPQQVAALNIRTARIIKRLQPNAKISGLAMGHIDLNYADAFFKVLQQQKAFTLFANFTYHDYVYNPDLNYCHVEALQRLLHQYDKNGVIRQGENGCPSEPGNGRGALGNYNWTELSQAKWIMRRMLGDLGHGIECSILGIIDIAYSASGPINRLNVKGLLKSDTTRQVLRPKMAYYAVQNIASVFDHSLQQLTDLHFTYNINSAGPGQHRYTKSTDRDLSIYGFQNSDSQKQLYALWLSEQIPANTNDVQLLTLSFSNANFSEPVLVDMLTGGIYQIPQNEWSKTGNTYTFKNIPVYDGPVLIADKSLIKF